LAKAEMLVGFMHLRDTFCGIKVRLIDITIKCATIEIIQVLQQNMLKGKRRRIKRYCSEGS